MKGFVSTSIRPGTAASFGGSSVRLEIASRKGVYLEAISQHDQEKEYLMDHDSRFRVAGIKELEYSDGSKLKTIQLIQEV
jgi:hypothetical protein